MDIAAIDYWANNRTSPLHRASALGKGVTVALVIAAVAVAWSPFLLLSIYLTLLAGVFLTRLPARALVALAAYPTLFAALFALSRWDGTWTTPAVILLKSLTAAQAMVLLISTTPYPDVFSALGRLLPRLVADGLLITYRSLFVLLEELDHMLTALRLRGGLRRNRPIESGSNVARSLGMILIRAVDLAERLYDVLRVRGYRGRIATTGRWRAVSRWDALPLTIGVISFAVSGVAVVRPLMWQAASGYVLVASALTLLAVLSLTRPAWRRSSRAVASESPIPAGGAAVPPALESRPVGRPEPNGATASVAVDPSAEQPALDRAGPRAHPHSPVDLPAQEGEVARVSCVRHHYPDGTEVSLCGLDFVAHRGEGVVILGPNGAGKSTLLYHLLGMLRSDEGIVRVLGRDPAREFEAIQPRIGVLVQNVDDQLLGPTVADDVAFGPRSAGLPAPEVEARVSQVLRRFDLEPLAGKVVHYLSGGEKRKVALAGALATSPEILILDEPFEGLDPRSRRELVSLLVALRQETGLTVIVTTHDVDLVPRLADTVYVLAEGGSIIARGTPEEVFHRREILEISNIEAPALTLLFHRLREAGVDLGSPSSLDDATRRLVEAVKGEAPEDPREVGRPLAPRRDGEQSPHPASRGERGEG